MLDILRKPKVIQWTNHAHAKMRYYGLSEQRVRRVLHTPKRVEEGIAPKTVAFMQPNSIASSKWQVASSGERKERKETWKQEIWVMIQNKRQGTGDTRQDVTVVISAWRYPGMTKPGASLPDAIVREVREGAVALSEESLAVRERMKGMLKKWRRGYANPKLQIPNHK